ncbi:MAG: hypothetical protein GY711_14500 [bacterium]|nr:hypothetical protein [bacterium]
MSPIGRIFIVLNLVLAVLFLGWSGTHLATAQNYKQQATDLQNKYDTDVAAKEDEISTLRSDKGKLESSLGNTRTEKDGLEDKNTLLTTQLGEEKQNNSTLRSSVDSIDGKLAQYATAIDNLRSQNEQLTTERAAADEARHQAENAQQAAVEDASQAREELAEAQMQVAQLEKDVTSSTKEVSNLETKLSVLITQTGADPNLGLSMPVIDGAVLNVDYDIEPGLVAINKGSNDGVMRGFTFDIYRGGQYKGQVRVENVQSGMATCVITKTWEGRTISQGDSASTRI